MKPEWNKKYATIAVYAFLTCAAIIVFLSIIVYRESAMQWLNKLASIMSPVLYGIVIAYLLAPMDTFFCRLAKKLLMKLPFFKKKEKEPNLLPRVISLILSYTVLALIIACFFTLLPEIGKSLEELSTKLITYYNTIYSYITSLDIPMLEISNAELQGYLTHAFDIAKGVVPWLYGFFGSFVTESMNVIIGILISIYVLWGRQMFKKRFVKLLHAFYEKETVEKVISFGDQVNKIFGGFICGKLLDSAIVGMLAFVAMKLIQIPYATLISVVIGITNIIPVFGPFIGAIPSAILVFIVQPEKTIWFVIMILALQQLDGNVIGPKILGESTGLPAFWVIFSIILFGGLFGVFGMIIAVPVFALAYNCIKAFSEKRLKEKGMPTDTNLY